MILNLGCGLKPMAGKGIINHDIERHHEFVDVEWDLDIMPWAWQDNEFAQIYSIDVFEHLIPNLIQVLNECHRILKPDGILHLKYPLYTSARIHDDPTHRHFYSLNSVDYVDDKTDYGKRYGFYTTRRWQILSKSAHKDLSAHVKMKVLK